MLTDEKILERIVARDQLAFEDFYDRYAARVLGMLVKIVGDRSGAEDVLQETFWNVWLKADRFDPVRGRARTWLFLMARSKGIDHLRRRPARGGEPAEKLAAPATDPVESREVRSVVDDLPEEQAVALRLAFFKGLTQSEIAKKLSLPLGTVKTRIRLGMQKLRDMMREVQS